MVKIKGLGEEQKPCLVVLETMFTKFGIKPLNPNNPMPYWIAESNGHEGSLLDKTVLTEDEQENQLRAVFFITRKKNCKKLKLFRFTELFTALHLNEDEVTINEAIEAFIQEKTDHIPPIVVVSLGKLVINDEMHAGAFLYEVPVNREIYIEAVSPKVLKESGFPEESEE